MKGEEFHLQDTGRAPWPALKARHVMRPPLHIKTNELSGSQNR